MTGPAVKLDGKVLDPRRVEVLERLDPDDVYALVVPRLTAEQAERIREDWERAWEKDPRPRLIVTDGGLAPLREMDPAELRKIGLVRADLLIARLNRLADRVSTLGSHKLAEEIREAWKEEE